MAGFDGSSNCWWPTLPVQVKRSQRLDVAKYGDGYEQRTLNGINTATASWDLTFQSRPEWVLLEMDAFLELQKAQAFPFLEPVTGKIFSVFCDEWSISWDFRRGPRGDRVAYGTLSATFRLAYGVGLVAA